MLMTKRRPASVGEILAEEFMEPMGLTQVALAEAMGVQRKHVNELCNNRRKVTAATALIFARCSAIVRTSGSMCRSVVICGRRYAHPTNARELNAPSR